MTRINMYNKIRFVAEEPEDVAVLMMTQRKIIANIEMSKADRIEVMRLANSN